MKLIKIFSLTLLAATLTFAQVNKNYDGPKPEIVKGSKSFVFRYTPFQSNFDPVYVSTVSVFETDNMDLFGAGFRYFFSHQIAVVLGLNFGTGSTSQEFQNGDKTETSSSTGINFGFDWYFTEGLSLGGKYTLGYRSLGKPEEKSGNTTVEGQSSSSFGVGSASVILNVHL
jgi:hypothetical protein